jgi:hypothetical protein
VRSDLETRELFDRINEGVQEERFAAIRRNIGRNRQFIDKWGGLRHLSSSLAAKHCVIVGAGPSLDAEIANVKKISERGDCVLIAADMACSSLMRRGIAPRYVISCETTPRDFFARTDTSGITLLAFSGVCSRIVREWAGPIRFYNWMIRSEPYESLWKEAGLDLGFVATGSIVTTQAVSIALGCGIKSMALVGNDLGFRDSFYSRGAARSDDFARIVSRLQPHPQIEYHACRRSRQYIIKRDRDWYTNHQFFAAKRWLEDLFAKQNVVVYDASIPGCAGKNIEKISFKEYCGKILARRGGSR